MLHFSRLATTSILAILLAALVVVVPNFFPKSTVDNWPGWLPKGQIVLGLDLQGGSYLLFEVDRNAYAAQRLNTLATEVRDALATEPRIGFSGLNRQQVAQNLVVQVRINPEDLSRLEEVRTRLEALLSPLDAGAFGTGVNEFELDITADGIVRMTYNPAALTQRVRDITQQSIEVIERRINALGTVEPNIQREGEDRIVVEAPGDGDPTRLLEIIGQTAQMTFHMVRQTLQSTTGVPAATTADGIVLPDADQPGIFYEVDPNPLLTGEQLVDARATFQQPSNQPVVQFRFNSTGARIFGETTAANVNRLFAIVLDNEVITAPRINSPILGGTGIIEGQFTTETANNLAILLRAGALPARLEVDEQRSVGPSLGADSIRAGIIAMVVATLGIACFMFCFY
ncbi:MAG: protein translocase subunit SecD, partial [Bauldia sp.]